MHDRLELARATPLTDNFVPLNKVAFRVLYETLRSGSNAIMCPLSNTTLVKDTFLDDTYHCGTETTITSTFALEET